MSERRLIAAYACLVGMPLCGLVGILRVGQHLVAPAFVGGTWTMSADLSGAPARTACAEWLSDTNQPALRVEQSGSHAIVTLKNSQETTRSALVQGGTLTIITDATTPAKHRMANCTEAHAMYLDATIHSEGEQRVLEGTLGVTGCGGCGPVAFRAVRHVASVKGGR